MYTVKLLNDEIFYSNNRFLGNMIDTLNVSIIYEKNIFNKFLYKTNFFVVHETS